MPGPLSTEKFKSGPLKGAALFSVPAGRGPAQGQEEEDQSGAG